MLNKEYFSKAMSFLVKAFPEKDFDFDILWCFLNDLEPTQLSSSIARIICNKQEINKSTNMVALIRDNAFFCDEKNTAEAWSEVMKAIGKFGGYEYPKFSSETIKNAVDCIGWKCLCNSENIAIERAHFFKVYESYLQRQKNNYVVDEKLKKIINSSPAMLN